MITKLDMSEVSESIITHVMSANFEWFYETISTSPSFPYMSHTVLTRTGEIKSYMFEPMQKLVNVFCRVTETPFNRILRMSFNQVVHYSAPHTDPHIDISAPHKVLLFYPHTSDAHTLVYRKKFKENSPITCILLREMGCESKQDMEVIEKIKPERGLAVCFDGAHFHANEFPKESERRVVCVVCFE